MLLVATRSIVSVREVLQRLLLPSLRVSVSLGLRNLLAPFVLFRSEAERVVLDSPQGCLRDWPVAATSPQAQDTQTNH